MHSRGHKFDLVNFALCLAKNRTLQPESLIFGLERPILGRQRSQAPDPRDYGRDGLRLVSPSLCEKCGSHAKPRLQAKRRGALREACFSLVEDNGDLIQVPTLLMKIQEPLDDHVASEFALVPEATERFAFRLADKVAAIPKAKPTLQDDSCICDTVLSSPVTFAAISNGLAQDKLR